jgi:hypothetical protein
MREKRSEQLSWIEYQTGVILLGPGNQHSVTQDDTLEFPLQVHKNENFFGFDFEFCTISC